MVPLVRLLAQTWLPSALDTRPDPRTATELVPVSDPTLLVPVVAVEGKATNDFVAIVAELVVVVVGGVVVVLAAF